MLEYYNKTKLPDEFQKILIVHLKFLKCVLLKYMSYATIIFNAIFT